MSERPTLTIAQVIDQFDLSRATVRRNIESGKFDGAYKDDQGRWLVPVNTLVAAGVKPRKTWLNEVAKSMATEHAREYAHDAQNLVDPFGKKVAAELARSEDELAQHASRIALLEAQLESEQRLRKAAERNADDLRTALRMIEAAPTPLQPITPHRRWWQRTQR